MADNLKNESGLAVVEATFLLPFCMLMVIAVFFASIFLCQKANLQANLENALVYFKNLESDTYVDVKEKDFNQNVGGTVGLDASKFDYDSKESQFPYRFIKSRVEESEFESFFRDLTGYMFFDDGSNVDISVNTINYVFYKEIRATATQEVKMPINLKMLGIEDNTVTITASGKAIINDADEFIRNTDLAIDLLQETKVGKYLESTAGKFKEYYERFKERFNVE